MDWYFISISRDQLTKGEYRVLHLLLHEWGHRTISPYTIEQGIAWAVFMEQEGLSSAVAKDLVNIAADTWVDDWYLGREPWAEAYANSIKAQIQEFGGKLLEGRNRGCPHFAEDVLRFMTGLYEALLEATGHKPRRKNLAGLDDAGKAGRRAYAALAAPLRSVEDRLKALITEGGRYISDIKRRERVVDLLALLGRRSILPSGQWVQIDLSRLARYLRQLKVKQDQAEKSDIIPSHRRRDLAREMRKLELYEIVVAPMEKLFRRRAPKEWCGFQIWMMGMSMRQLQLEETIQRHGELLANITTLRRAYRERGPESAIGSAAHICCIIDDSGSTSSETIFREQEAAFAALLSARRKRDLFSLVAFGSQVTRSMEPGFDYSSGEDLVCGLQGESGGTALMPALQRALEFTERREGTSVLVFTDTGVGDMDACLPVLMALTRRGRVVMFCFASPADVQNFREKIPRHANIKIYAHPQGAQFLELTLQEVV